MVSEKEKEQHPPLWNFFPLAEYTVPTYPARGMMEKKWDSFKSFFRTQDAKKVCKGEDELRKLRGSRLAHLLSEPDCQYLAKELDSFLENNHEAGDDSSVSFLVGPPGGSAETYWSKTVQEWSKIHEAVIISPPACQEILAGETRWLDEILDTQSPWVIPSLENCYLRHVYGLDGIRRFFTLLEKQALPSGLVACDSWAWSFFGKIGQVTQLNSFTLQEFDAKRLVSLLPVLTRHSKASVCYKNAITGNTIFSSEQEDVGKVLPELVDLAAYSRGNLEIALQVWRSRLRREPEAESEKANAKESTESNEEITIWVSSDLSTPLIPKDSKGCALILHSLLMHNGVSEDILLELLPLTESQCRGALTILEEGGIIHRDGDCWLVSSLAYNRVREYLKSYGYIVDMF